MTRDVRQSQQHQATPTPADRTLAAASAEGLSFVCVAQRDSARSTRSSQRKPAVPVAPVTRGRGLYFEERVLTLVERRVIMDQVITARRRARVREGKITFQSLWRAPATS